MSYFKGLFIKSKSAYQQKSIQFCVCLSLFGQLSCCWFFCKSSTI